MPGFSAEKQALQCNWLGTVHLDTILCQKTDTKQKHATIGWRLDNKY